MEDYYDGESIDQFLGRKPTNKQIAEMQRRIAEKKAQEEATEMEIRKEVERATIAAARRDRFETFQRTQAEISNGGPIPNYDQAKKASIVRFRGPIVRRSSAKRANVPFSHRLANIAKWSLITGAAFLSVMKLGDLAKQSYTDTITISNLTGEFHNTYVRPETSYSNNHKYIIFDYDGIANHVVESGMDTDVALFLFYRSAYNVTDNTSNQVDRLLRTQAFNDIGLEEYLAEHNFKSMSDFLDAVENKIIVMSKMSSSKDYLEKYDIEHNYVFNNLDFSYGDTYTTEPGVTMVSNMGGRR